MLGLIVIYYSANIRQKDHPKPKPKITASKIAYSISSESLFVLSENHGQTRFIFFEGEEDLNCKKVKINSSYGIQISTRVFALEKITISG